MRIVPSLPKKYLNDAKVDSLEEPYCTQLCACGQGPQRLMEAVCKEAGLGCFGSPRNPFSAPAFLGYFIAYT